MPKRASAPNTKPVQAFLHDDERRVYLPSAEDQPLMRAEE